MFTLNGNIFFLTFLLWSIFFAKCVTVNNAINDFGNSKEIDAKQVNKLSNSFMNFENIISYRT